MLRTDAQTEQTRYRVILFRERGTEVLLTSNGSQFTFPETNIPKLARTADSFVRAMERDWEQEIICLFPAECAGSDQKHSGPRYYVAETACVTDAPCGAHWLPVSSTNDACFSDRGDYQTFCSVLARCCREHSASCAPFEKLGWFEDVRDWIAATLRPYGLTLRHAFRQRNASPTFSLIRFETDGPAVWFKAVGEPNRHEFAISVQLARLLPRFVPELIGTHAPWNAWLSLEFEGLHLNQNSPLTEWTRTTEALTQLQMASFGSVMHLVDAGCKDYRNSMLLCLVDHFMGVMSEIMREQSKLTPAPLTSHELQCLGEDLKRSLSNLDEAGIPCTLGHLDLNPGNILISAERCVFLDWSEACIAHPFIAVHYLLEHLRKLRPEDPSWEHAVISAYTRKWEFFAAPEVIARALELSRAVAVFVYATLVASSHLADPARRPQTAPYLRSLTRRMKREVDVLRERRLLCVR